MSKIFLIVLFVTILYNGVTYSSPVKDTSSDLIAKEAQVSLTAVPDISNHKTEASTPQNGTHIESPVKTNSTNQLNGNAKNSQMNATAVNGTSSLKNDSLNTPIPVTKNSTVALNTTLASNTTKPESPVPETKKASSLAPEKFTEMPRPVPAGQSTTASTIPGTETTTKAPVTKPSIETSTMAVSSTTESALKDHNSSSKTEQKGFDGASFVGGIVLTIGLTAIGFIAFKYYKAGKMDGNYRTL